MIGLIALCCGSDAYTNIKSKRMSRKGILRIKRRLVILRKIPEDKELPMRKRILYLNGQKNMSTYIMPYRLKEKV